MPAIPKGERCNIAIIGKRNAGKSSLINAMTSQDISIVSNTPGTTTDPVKKNYELLPIGPVSIIDTAGIDDLGELGEKRVKSTRKVLWRTDIALIVTDEHGITDDVKAIIEEVRNLSITTMVVFNKNDISEVDKSNKDYCRLIGLPYISVSSKSGKNIRDMKEKMADLVPTEFLAERVLVGDLVNPGDQVVLVVPIDLAAPKGRLIMPQVQVLREILDNDAIGIMVKERELEDSLMKLKNPPDLIITDSQVILKVDGDVPEEIPLTTFSTLFARYKGELGMLVDGASAIDKLEDGDKVVIAESCSHHVQADDIGRVKIPRWLRQYTGKDIKFDVYSGHDFPDNLEEYKLVLHCGACMTNRMEMIRRMRECNRRGVPITNYGVAISKLHGVLERVIKPFYK